MQHQDTADFPSHQYASDVAETAAIVKLLGSLRGIGLQFVSLVISRPGERDILQSQEELAGYEFGDAFRLELATNTADPKRKAQFVVDRTNKRVSINGNGIGRQWADVQRAVLEHFPAATLVPLSTEHQEAADAYISQLGDAIARWKTLLNDASSRITANDKAHADRLDLLERTYNEKLKLEAPAKYWEEAKKDYQSRSNWFLGATVLWVAGLLIASLIAVLLIIDFDSTRPPTWGFVAFVVLFGVGTWIAQLLARSWLSARHLREDARHRELMVWTYLALTKDAQVDPGHRLVVLEHLFRPATFGLLRNELPPMGAQDALRRLTGGP